MNRILADLGTLFMLTNDYMGGRYRDVSWWLVAAVVFTVMYIVSPLDLVPDFIPVLGQMDDIAVVLLCLRLIGTELDKYRRWRQG